AAEMEARLALRTAEERARALAGRAEQLERAAETERQERARAVAREERRRRQIEAARSVLAGAQYALVVLEAALQEAEVARAEQRMRIDALEARGLEELGLEPDALVAEYGPDRPVPATDPESDGQ